jgi:hypothetical protein
MTFLMLVASYCRVPRFFFLFSIAAHAWFENEVKSRVDFRSHHGSNIRLIFPGSEFPRQCVSATPRRGVKKRETRGAFVWQKRCSAPVNQNFFAHMLSPLFLVVPLKAGSEYCSGSDGLQHESLTPRKRIQRKFVWLFWRELRSRLLRRACFWKHRFVFDYRRVSVLERRPLSSGGSIWSILCPV